MADFMTVAQQFIDFYNNTFDANRANLESLYVRCSDNIEFDKRPSSMLTFESNAVQGATAIVAKLVELPFQKVKHAVATLDAQPSINNGIVVLVTGALLVDDEQRPMNYAQTFQLLPENNSYYVHNDLFKLIYG